MKVLASFFDRKSFSTMSQTLCFFSCTAVLQRRLQSDSKIDFTTKGLLSENFRMNRPRVVNFKPEAKKTCKTYSSLCLYG